MIKEAIATGDTVQIAYEKACRELGVEADAAEYEILEMPVKKTFGLFGGAPAKVRAFIKTSPADSASDYLREVLRNMGLSDVTITATEEENGAVLSISGENIGFVKRWTPCNIWLVWWPTMRKVPTTALRSISGPIVKSAKKRWKRWVRRLLPKL